MTSDPQQPSLLTQRMLLLDRTNDTTERDVLYPFALDELLCRNAGAGGPAICHLWRHPRAFVLGLRDSRLPYAGHAIEQFRAQQWSVAVRNTGGAAVPLDAGVINISLILPKVLEAGQHFHHDFELMAALIRDALRNTGVTVDTGEIQGAFCPGDYDLSIRGLKFCGIAQRRQAKSYIVQAFIIAEGSGQARAHTARQFYELATAGADAAKLEFPQVAEDSTASLEELTSLGEDAALQFITAVKDIVRNPSLHSTSMIQMPAREEIYAMMDTLRSRYEAE